MKRQVMRTAELVRRAQSGDQQALAKVIARYRERVQAIVRIRLGRRLRGCFDTEDVVRGTFAEALEHVDQLSTVDTTGVEATRHPVPLPTPLRDDRVGEHLSPAEALDNAPESDGESFIVPRVV